MRACLWAAPCDCTRAQRSLPPHRIGRRAAAEPRANHARSRASRSTASPCSTSATNFNQINPNWFDTMRVTKLPSFEDQFGKDGSTFAGVRQSRLGVQVHDADRARRARRRRSSSSCSAPASTRARRRSACGTPTASSARSAPARPGARSWTSTCSPTRSSTGARPAWCSSATSRCAGCRSRATRG